MLYSVRSNRNYMRIVVSINAEIIRAESVQTVRHRWLIVISLTFLTPGDYRFYVKILHVSDIWHVLIWCFSAMNFKIRVFWDVTPCGLLDCCRPFGVTWCVLIQSGTCLPYYMAAQIPGVLSPWGLNFVLWQLIFSAYFLQSLFITNKNAYHFTCTEQKGPDNSEVRRPFQNCGSHSMAFTSRHYSGT